MCIPGVPAPRKSNATTLHPHAARVPTEISVSIVAVACLS